MDTQQESNNPTQEAFSILDEIAETLAAQNEQLTRVVDLLKASPRNSEGKVIRAAAETVSRSLVEGWMAIENTRGYRSPQPRPNSANNTNRP